MAVPEKMVIHMSIIMVYESHTNGCRVRSVQDNHTQVCTQAVLLMAGTVYMVHDRINYHYKYDTNITLHHAMVMIILVV